MLDATDKSTCESVISLTWWTDALFCLKITRPAAYRFTPGQFSRLGLQAGDRGGNAEITWRAYSVTSAPDADHLEYYGITVPGGAFTGAVKCLAPGAPILLETQPNGFLTIDRFTGGESLWMLSTGTGLGPFISILRDPAVWTRFRQLVLVHCVRQAPEFAYADTLAALAEQYRQVPGAAQLRIVQSTTREPTDAQPGDAGDSTLSSRSAPGAPSSSGVRLQGRITTLLENGALEAAAGVPLAPATARLMLCGNPQMIDDTRKLLQQRGFLPVRRAIAGHYLTENYW